jgi:hypothetical protein
MADVSIVVSQSQISIESDRDYKTIRKKGFCEASRFPMYIIYPQRLVTESAQNESIYS